MMDDDKTFRDPFTPAFADVYIEDGTAGAGDPVKEEIIPYRPADPIQERFAQMRQLAREVAAGGLSNERYRERVFYKQALYMAGFEDDYPKKASFNMYFPYYQLMNYEQLRTYFTWRSRVRAGKYAPIDLSYIFLYIYELINNIGVSSGEDGLGKLLFLWEACRSRDILYEKVEKYLAAWIRDYYILNPCPLTFGELLERAPGLQKYYPLNAKHHTLEFYSDLSVYKIKQSKFFTAENEKMMTACFDIVLSRLNTLMGKAGVKFNDLIYDKGVEYRWYPFFNAIFYMKPEYWPRGPKTVKITDEYEYRYRNGRWTHTCPGLYSASGRQVTGYILKRMEQLLRRAAKYKFKLTADDKQIDKRLLDKLLPGIGSKGFLAEVDLAVKEYVINSRKTIVRVDESNLIKIRKNALITQEKLIVSEDDGAASPDVITPDAQLLYYAVEAVNEQTTINVSGTAPGPPAASETALLPQNTPLQEMATLSQTTVRPTDIWEAFAASLTPVETAALKKMLAGITVKDMAEFARDSGVMPEVLLDGINQKALDLTGDTILELADDMVVFDDYKEHLGKAVNRE
jgi:hypothetical protein